MKAKAVLAGGKAATATAEGAKDLVATAKVAEAVMAPAQADRVAVVERAEKVTAFVEVRLVTAAAAMEEMPRMGIRGGALEG